jgi:myo-inositol-1(or 4)-monophosphatase
VTEPSRADLLKLASSAAGAAAGLLVSRHERVEIVATKSSPTDVVTQMDRAAEELIRGRILAERPGDVILGEEGGQLGEAGRGDGVRWIVDPLDGTVNYLYGLPDWAVSIAAEMDGTVVAGVVCVPRRRSQFSAVLGGGAWLRSWPSPGLPSGLPSAPPSGAGTAPPSGASPGPPSGASPGPPSGASPGPPSGAGPGPARRLACNADVPLGEALVATGFGYEPGRRRVQGQVVAAVLPRVRDIRRGGSCAVDLCSLAAGQVDGYYERGVQAWDIAAGSLIAREAGAQVAGLSGRPAGPSMTLAGGPALFAELHDLLISLDPERDE